MIDTVPNKRIQFVQAVACREEVHRVKKKLTTFVISCELLVDSKRFKFAITRHLYRQQYQFSKTEWVY